MPLCGLEILPSANASGNSRQWFSTPAFLDSEVFLFVCFGFFCFLFFKQRLWFYIFICISSQNLQYMWDFPQGLERIFLDQKWGLSHQQDFSSCRKFVFSSIPATLLYSRRTFCFSQSASDVEHCSRQRVIFSAWQPAICYLQNLLICGKLRGPGLTEFS